MTDLPKAYIFVHVICCVNRREPLLGKPVRRILFAHLQKDAGEKGISVIAVNGVEDHIHLLLQLMPTQNLSQALRTIRTESARWLNDTKLLKDEFLWEDSFAAYSVSPSSVKQVIDYIGRQEEHHQLKSLDSELEIFKAPPL